MNSKASSFSTVVALRPWVLQVIIQLKNHQSASQFSSRFKGQSRKSLEIAPICEG